MNQSCLRSAPVENLTREINLDLGPGTYLIQIKWKNVDRTLKWDSKSRLALDHPGSYFLVKDTGRAMIHVVRGHAGSDGKYDVALSFPDPLPTTKADTCHEIPDVQGYPLRFRIARLARARAAYLPMISGGGSAFPQNVALYASCGVHGFLSAFEQLTHNGTFSGQIAQHQAFTLRRTSRASYIRSRLPGIVIKLKGKPSFELPPSQKITLSNEDLQSAKITLGEYWWRFNRLPTPVFSHLEVVDERDEEYTFFKKCVSLLGIGSLAILGLSLLTPKPRKIEDLVLDSTTIQLKKPVQLAAKPVPPPPKPTPVPVPPPPKPKPTPVALKPQEPKPAPKKKIELKPQPPKKIAKKSVEKPIEKPKKHAAVPQPAPKPVVVPKEAPPKPVVVAKAEPPVQVAPAPPKPVAPAPPPGPTAAQIKEAQAAQARAQLAKSLGFLASTPSKNAPARSVSGVSAGTEAPDTSYAAMGKAANGSNTGSTNALNSMAKNAAKGSGGSISTRSSRSIASDAGVSRGKGLNDVQGKVTLAALYNPNGGSELGSTLGGGSVSIHGKGSLEESQLLKTLSKYLQRFQYCYEKALLSNASLSGTLSMEWVIQENGKAQTIKVVRSELNHAPLHQCVSAELAKIPFPAPKGGPVTIKYPFAFSSSSL